jgi:hypothetical protein
MRWCGFWRGIGNRVRDGVRDGVGNGHQKWGLMVHSQEGVLVGLSMVLNLYDQQNGKR